MWLDESDSVNGSLNVNNSSDKWSDSSSDDNNLLSNNRSLVFWGSSELNGQMSDSDSQLSDLCGSSIDDLGESSNNSSFSWSQWSQFWLRFWDSWGWVSDVDDSSSGLVNSSSDSSDNLMKDNQLSSDNRSSWFRSRFEFNSQLVDGSSDWLELSTQSVDDLSESDDNSSLSWAQLNWFSVDWFFWNWVSDSSDDNSEWSNSSSDLADDSSKNNQLSGDNWSSWFWSGLKFSDQSVDSLSNDSDLVGEVSDSNSGLSDDNSLGWGDDNLRGWSDDLVDSVVAGMNLVSNSSQSGSGFSASIHVSFGWLSSANLSELLNEGKNSLVSLVTDLLLLGDVFDNRGWEGLWKSDTFNKSSDSGWVSNDMNFVMFNNWSSDLVNGVSNVSNSMGDSSDNGSKSDDSLLDQWSLGNWSSSQGNSQSVDNVVNSGNLSNQSVNSLVESLDNSVFFWSWSEWKWLSFSWFFVVWKNVNSNQIVRKWDIWLSDHMDGSSDDSGLSDDSTQSSSKNNELSSDDWSSWSWGSSKFNSQVMDGSSDNNGLLSQLNKSWSETLDELSDWSWNEVMFFNVRKRSNEERSWSWGNRSWSSHSNDSSSDSSDNSSGSSNNLSQNNKLSSDNWLLVLWSGWKGSDELVDGLSNNGNLVGQLGNSLSEVSDNLGDFWRWSWSRFFFWSRWSRKNGSEMETSLSSSSVGNPLDFEVVTGVVTDLHTGTNSSHGVNIWVSLELFISTGVSFDSTVGRTFFVSLVDGSGNGLVVSTGLRNGSGDFSWSWVNVWGFDNWSSQVSDCSSSSSNLSSESSELSSESSELSSEDWSSWKRSGLDNGDKVDDSLSDWWDLSSDNLNSVSQNNNSVLFFWLESWRSGSWKNDWFWFGRMFNVVNDSSDIDNSSSDLSKGSSKNNNLLSQDWLFFLWSLWNSADKDSDLVSDDWDSVSQLVDSLSELNNNSSDFLRWFWSTGNWSWSVGDLSDSSSDMDNSVSERSESSSEDNDSSSDNWSSWFRGGFNNLGEMGDSLSDVSDSLGDSGNSVSELINEGLFSWFKMSWFFNWFNVFWNVWVNWSFAVKGDNWNWGSQSSNNLSDVDDLSSDNSSGVSQNNDSSLDWSSFWFWELWKSLSQFLDVKGDLVDSSSQFNNSLVEDMDDMSFFWGQLSWLWQEWILWLWSDSGSDVNNSLSEDSDSVSKSGDSLSDNRWLFWFWNRIDVDFTDNLSWSSSDDVDLVVDLGDLRSDSSDLLSDWSKSCSQNSDVLDNSWSLFFWNGWDSNNFSNNLSSDSSDLSNQMGDLGQLSGDGLSQDSNLLGNWGWVETGKGWSSQSSESVVDSSDRLGALFLNSIFSLVALSNTARAGSLEFIRGGISLSRALVLGSVTGVTGLVSGLFNSPASLVDGSRFLFKSSELSNLLLGVSTGVNWLHERWMMDENVKVLNEHSHLLSVSSNSWNKLLQSSSVGNNLLVDGSLL